MWSEKRGSNPRPQPWQGCALPAELFSLLSWSELILFYQKTDSQSFFGHWRTTLFSHVTVHDLCTTISFTKMIKLERFPRKSRKLNFFKLSGI